jgi:hypothetical protein
VRRNKKQKNEVGKKECMLEVHGKETRGHRESEELKKDNIESGKCK